MSDDLSALCGASTQGLAEGGMIGPCVLRADHDGPVHQDADGVRWTAPGDLQGSPSAGSNDLREELAAVINAAGREVDLNAVRALVAHVQPKLDRLAFELRHTRAELGKADAENNAAGRRAERAERENELLRIRATGADQRNDILTRRIARVRQMADAWERNLPGTIRTAVAAQAIRDATEEGT